METIKSIKLDIEQFRNLHHCIYDWITEVRNIFYEDLNFDDRNSFDWQSFENKQIEELFLKFDYVELDENDSFYGIKGNKKFPISHCEGAWEQAVESKLIEH
jgi:hypothetical protein